MENSSSQLTWILKNIHFIKMKKQKNEGTKQRTNSSRSKQTRDLSELSWFRKKKNNRNTFWEQLGKFECGLNIK